MLLWLVTAAPAPFSLWVCVCPVGQHIEFAPNISLNYISIIAIELCNLWCVLLHSHTNTHTQGICTGVLSGLKHGKGL